MKKILFIIGDLNDGGAEKVLYDILNNLSYKKYEIELFLLENSGVYLEKLKNKKNLRIEFLFLKRKKNYKNIFYKKISTFLYLIKLYFYCKYPFFIKKLRNKNYDIEIAFLEGYPTLLLSNRENNSKKIAWIHTNLEKHRIIGINKKFERKNYKKIDKLICVSEDSKKSVLNLYPETKEKLQVIYNPIDKDNIIKRSEEKIDINFDKNKINIIAIGRLTKVKGFDILLQSHNKLIKEGLDYNLIILGEGGERKNLEKYIKQNNLENNVKLLGFKENPYPYLNKTDIFISSSLYEGFSLVVAEAICLNKPVIATKCTGPLELLENGKYGLITEVGNIEDLAEKMKKMISDYKLREKYSNLSKKRAEIFNIRKTMHEIEELLDEK